MGLSIDPLGGPRLVFLGYESGESPAESPHAAPPEVVLVRPNETSPEAFYSGKFRENLGVMTVAAHIANHGVRLGLMEASLFQCTPEETAELVTECRPHIVGISVYCTYILGDCLRLASLIRERAPDAVIVLGGHGASFVGEEILLDNPPVDAVVRGEGEEPFLQLVRAGNERGKWASIPNLTYRHGGTINGNAVGAIEKDLDRSTLPHRATRDLMLEDPVLAAAPLMLFSSKGCFDRCTFCTVTAFYGGLWRGRSAAHVVDEIEALTRRYDQPKLHFWDDTFTGPGKAGKRRAIAIADEILRRELKVTFHITGRASDLSEEVVAALAKAGLRSVFIGVETSVQSVLDDFDKHTKAGDSIEAIERLWRHGVHRILIGFILFHPTMSWTTFRSDLDFLDGLPTAECSRIFSRMCNYPGAQSWLQDKEEIGKDAYKTVHHPALPERAFEELYRAMVNFFQPAVPVEMLFVCLEERYLDRLDVIDFLASCRSRLFRFISVRARVVADLLEHGRDHLEAARSFRYEIFLEALRVTRAMQERLGDEYFDRLILANQLVGYERFLETGTPAAAHGEAGGTGLAAVAGG